MVRQLLKNAISYTCIITKDKQYNVNVYSRIQIKGYTRMKLSPFTHVYPINFYYKKLKFSDWRN